MPPTNGKAGRRVESAALREEYVEAELDRGLRAVVVPKRGFTRKYAGLTIPFGSAVIGYKAGGGPETRLPEGVAHFLEHKVFEGERGHALELFSRLGASSNAYTSFTHTHYYFGTSEDLWEPLDLLLDFVFHPVFTKEGVEKEKGIIGQEIKMYDDYPSFRIYFSLLKALYHVHPIRESPAGTVESIARIDHEMLKACHDGFYHPSVMSLVVGGDLDPSEVFDRVSARVKGFSFPPARDPVPLDPGEPPSIRARDAREKMPLSLPRFLLGFKEPRALPPGLDFARREVVTDLLLDQLFGESAPLYLRLYEAGVVDEGFSASYYGEADFSTTVIGGESRDPARVIDAVRDEIRGARSAGLDRVRFDRLRRKLIGEFVGGFDSVESAASNWMQARLRGIGPFDYFDLIRTIRVEDLAARLAEHLLDDQSAVAYLDPMK